MKVLHKSEVAADNFWFRILDWERGYPSSEKVLCKLVLVLLFLRLLPRENELHLNVWRHIEGRSFLDEKNFNGVDWIDYVVQRGRENSNVLMKLYYFVSEVLGGQKSDRIADEYVYERVFFDLARMVDEVSRSESSENILEYYFDRGFFYLFEGSKRFDIALEGKVSQFAVSLLGGRVRSVADFYGVTGQFAIEVARRQKSGLELLLGSNVQITLELKMRLMLNGIRFLALSPIFGKGSRFGQDLNRMNFERADVCLINFDNLSPSGENERRYNISAEEMIDVVVWGVPLRISNSLTIAIQSKACNTRLGKYARLREKIIESNRLIASVALPFSGASKTSRELSAWIIERDRVARVSESKSTVFIDAAALTHLPLENQAADIGRFVGRVISLVSDGETGNFELPRQKDVVNGLLDNIIKREFVDGYRNIDGVCRQVGLQEMASNKYRFFPGDYVVAASGEARLAVADWRELRSDLEVRSGITAYVIGNNGQGKSFLLRELVHHFLGDGAKVCAIASGMTDRFPSQKEAQHPGRYFYMGAKTNQRSVDSSKIAAAAGGLIRVIHNDDAKIHALTEVVRIIGFSADYYLIPLESVKRKAVAGGLINGVVQVPASSPSDWEMLKHLDEDQGLAAKYGLGLRRISDAEIITPFEELSSGEQQILLLVLKLVAHAEHNVVFLVDEPEISLHVSWQQAIPKLFGAVSRSFGCLIIVATHSPVIIAAATSVNDRCYSMAEHKLSFIPVEQRRSVEVTLFEGFKTHTPHNREIPERCALLVSHGIDLANEGEMDEVAYEQLIGKLDDMKLVVEKSLSAFEDDKSGMSMDMGLIDDAKQAIVEIARVRQSAND